MTARGIVAKSDIVIETLCDFGVFFQEGILGNFFVKVSAIRRIDLVNEVVSKILEAEFRGWTRRIGLSLDHDSESLRTREGALLEADIMRSKNSE